MSWKRKSIDQHRILRQSQLYKQRVETLKTQYKRHPKYKKPLESIV
jgi:hypothetical protein